MENNLVKLYKARCKLHFYQYGFKWYGNNAYRVVNDMFQSYNLHRSVSGNACIVEFASVPLCSGDYINKSYCGANHIKRFESDYSWFDYDRTDEASIENCVEDIIIYMSKYLMPFFEASSNSYDAYHTLICFQRDHYPDGIFWGDPTLFHLAIKAGLYSEAAQHLVAWKEHNLDAYKTNAEGFERIGKELPKEYVIRSKKEIEKLDFWREQLSSSNYEFFSNLMQANEIVALRNLRLL